MRTDLDNDPTLKRVGPDGPGSHHLRYCVHPACGDAEFCRPGRMVLMQPAHKIPSSHAIPAFTGLPVGDKESWPGEERWLLVTKTGEAVVLTLHGGGFELIPIGD